MIKRTILVRVVKVMVISNSSLELLSKLLNIWKVWRALILI